MVLVVNLGSYASDTLTGAKTLTAAAIINKYQTLFSVAGVEYQVPADKQFTIGKVSHFATTVQSRFVIGYGDDIVNDSATPPTNAVQLDISTGSRLAYQQYNNNIIFNVPANKYPYIFCNYGYVYVSVMGAERN